MAEQEEEATFTAHATRRSTKSPSSTISEDRSASMAFEAMQEPDPWMKRHGIGGNSSSVSEKGDFDKAPYGQEPTELAVGRKNRDEEKKKKLKTEASKVRAEAIESGSFQNNGLPPVLYRFVSNEAAKDIKKNGIVHTGTDLDEIPFIAQPKKSIALSIGAVSTEKMVTVFTDKIPSLSANNIDTLRQRNSVVAYKLNISIPRDAIDV